jgi:hypothetical protein
MDLLSDSAAAHEFTPFEHKGLQACLRQITSSDKTIVTATDDDDVVHLNRTLNFELCSLRWSHLQGVCGLPPSVR